MNNESAWLIEHVNRLLWVSNPAPYHPRNRWCWGTASEAIRFCRQEDAYQTSLLLGLTPADCKITEHLWCDAAPKGESRVPRSAATEQARTSELDGAGCESQAIHQCSVGTGGAPASNAQGAPVISAAPKEPEPAICEFCTNPMPDTDGHGLGECVPVCDRCDGSGVDPGPRCESCGTTGDTVRTGDDVDLCEKCAKDIAEPESPAEPAQDDEAAIRDAEKRDEDRAKGYEPDPLEDNSILTSADIAELAEGAEMFVGDRVGGPKNRDIAEYEMVCSRSEYVAMARNLGRFAREKDDLRAEVERLRTIITAAATQIRVAHEKEDEGAPCAASNHYEEALNMLADHAGAWSPECAKLRDFTTLGMVCKENSDLRAKLADAHEQLRCPDCGCATPEEAEAGECGCDSPVCSVEVTTTVAKELCDVAKKLAAAEARITEMRGIAKGFFQPEVEEATE